MIHSVAFSPDGSRIASGSGNADLDILSGSIRLWDTSNLEKGSVATATSTVPIYSLAFSPDGTRAVRRARALWSIGPDKEVISNTTTQILI